MPAALHEGPSKPSQVDFEDTKNWQKGLSACAGSFLTSLVVTPFDVIKTRLQFQSLSDTTRPETTKQSFTFCNGSRCLCPGVPRSLFFNEWPVSFNQVASSLSYTEPINPALRFTGTFDAFTKIAKHEGVSKLWRGLSPTLLQSFPSTVIYYVGYDSLRDYMFHAFSDSKMSVYSPLVAGALARSISATVISPLELFRTRLQSSGKGETFKTVAESVFSMVRSEGVKSLWRGLTPTLWRDIPFSATYWMGYETFKETITRSDVKLSPFGVSFLAGALSGTISAVVTTPFDVLKTRHQVQDEKSSSPKKDGTFRMLIRIVRQEGVKELFSGLTARVAKVAPACAIMVSSYELGKRFFAIQNVTSEELES